MNSCSFKTETTFYQGCLTPNLSERATPIIPFPYPLPPHLSLPFHSSYHNRIMTSVPLLTFLESEGALSDPQKGARGGADTEFSAIQTQQINHQNPIQVRLYTTPPHPDKQNIEQPRQFKKNLGDSFSNHLLPQIGRCSCFQP